MRRAVVIACLALWFLPLPANAGDAELRAVQATIEAQIGAFRAGDNEAAYSYAAPSIKRIFPTLDQFMAMVTGAYQPVWKPRNFASRCCWSARTARTTRRSIRWNCSRTARSASPG